VASTVATGAGLPVCSNILRIASAFDEHTRSAHGGAFAAIKVKGVQGNSRKLKFL
jgi:hypothetical protein